MDEYISREATIDAIKKIYCPQCNNYNGAMCRACEHMDDMDIIEDMPATGVQPVNQWISVKERLPETPEEGLGVRYSDCCLVCDSHDWCGMAYYLTDDKKSWWEFADAQNKVKIDWTEVTHWMPLPEPPKDGETNA